MNNFIVKLITQAVQVQWSWPCVQCFITEFEGVAPPCNLGFQWPYPHIQLENPMCCGRSGVNCQYVVGLFVCSSCYQKRKNIAFDLVLRSSGKFRVVVRNLLQVMCHVWKEAMFGVEKVSGGRDICIRAISVVKMEELWKKCSVLKGWWWLYYCMH